MNWKRCFLIVAVLFSLVDLYGSKKWKPNRPKYYLKYINSFKNLKIIGLSADAIERSDQLKDYFEEYNDIDDEDDEDFDKYYDKDKNFFFNINVLFKDFKYPNGKKVINELQENDLKVLVNLLENEDGEILKKLSNKDFILLINIVHFLNCKNVAKLCRKELLNRMTDKELLDYLHNKSKFLNLVFELIPNDFLEDINRYPRFSDKFAKLPVELSFSMKGGGRTITDGISAISWLEDGSGFYYGSTDKNGKRMFFDLLYRKSTIKKKEKIVSKNFDSDFSLKFLEGRVFLYNEKEKKTQHELKTKKKEFKLYSYEEEEKGAVTIWSYDKKKLAFLSSWDYFSAIVKRKNFNLYKTIKMPNCARERSDEEVEDKYVYIFSIGRMNVENTIKVKGLYDVDFSPSNSNILAVLSGDFSDYSFSSLKIFNLKTNKLLFKDKAKFYKLHSLSWSPDGNSLALVGYLGGNQANIHIFSRVEKKFSSFKEMILVRAIEAHYEKTGKPFFYKNNKLFKSLSEKVIEKLTNKGMIKNIEITEITFPDSDSEDEDDEEIIIEEIGPKSSK